MGVEKFRRPLLAKEGQSEIEALSTNIAANTAAIAAKKAGDYSATEFLTGGSWIDAKPIYRKVVDFGALPNTTTKSVAHSIANLADVHDIRFVIKGAGADWRLVPYTSLAGNVDISFSMDGTNVHVDTESDWSTFTGMVTIDYTKTT